MSSASRIPPVVSSGVSIASSRTRRSRSASYRSSIETSDSRRRKSLDGVARSRSTDRWRATSGWSTTVTPVIGADAIAWAPMTQPRRNVELKAHDPDPAADARARARRRRRGPRRAAPARHLLRGRAGPPEAARGGAGRRDADRLRAAGRPPTSASRTTGSCRSPSPSRCAPRSPRPAASAPSSSSGAGCSCGRRPDPPRRGRGPRAVRRARGGRRARLATWRASARRSRTCATLLEIARRRAARGLLRRRAAGDAARRRRPTPSCSRWPATPPAAPTRPTRTSPSAPRCARPTAAASRARTSRTRAYPQGQCAEASAIGAMVAGGGGRIAEVVVAAPSAELCAPCGGCRQRLREFAADDAPIHLVDLERVRRTTSLGELLPLSFGPEHLAGMTAAARRRSPSARPAFAPRLGLMLGSGLGDARRRGSRTGWRSPTASCPASTPAALAGHAGALVLGPARRARRGDLLRPLARLRGDRGERDHHADPHAQGARRRARSC